MEILGGMVDGGYDKSLYEGITKFNARLKKFTKNQTSSALCKFGTDQFANLQNHTTTAVRRAKWRLINVNPNAVTRRVSKNGSKKALKTGGSSQLLPVPLLTRKKKHVLSQNIATGVLPAKKHSQDMKSRRQPSFKPIKLSKKK